MEHFLKQIRQSWIIILFIAGVIVSWTMFSARLATAENEIESLSQVVTQINQININIAVMQTDINYIKNKVK